VPGMPRPANKENYTEEELLHCATLTSCFYFNDKAGQLERAPTMAPLGFEILASIDSNSCYQRKPLIARLMPLVCD